MGGGCALDAAFEDFDVVMPGSIEPESAGRMCQRCVQHLTCTPQSCADESAAHDVLWCRRAEHSAAVEYLPCETGTSLSMLPAPQLTIRQCRAVVAAPSHSG